MIALGVEIAPEFEFLKDARSDVGVLRHYHQNIVFSTQKSLQRSIDSLISRDSCPGPILKMYI